MTIELERPLELAEPIDLDEHDPDGCLSPQMLLLRALEYIEEHPREWRQDTWGSGAPREQSSCGMVGCLAGHAARLDGRRPHHFGWDYLKVPGTDQELDIQDWAMARFGFTASEAAVLFSHTRTMHQLKVGVLAYVDGKNIEDAVLGAVLEYQ